VSEPDSAAEAPDLRPLLKEVEAHSETLRRLEDQVGQVVIGQRRMVERLVIGLLTGGHVLLEGVPGLAKTLTVRTLSEALDASFSRIQFTPDLLPADVMGTLIFDPKAQDFVPKRGPVFANLVLADEINRAPAKVQSALLEAMQERQVTIGDESFPLPDPFLVLATQNPVEQEGTYPLPEAQQDRFMLHVKVGYPSRHEERRLLDQPGSGGPMEPVLRTAELAHLRSLTGRIHVDPKLKDYIVDLVWATRDPKAVGLESLEGLVELGASPRATLALQGAARAHALLRGRPAVFPEDVKAVGADVMRHRIKLTFEAEAEEVPVETVIQRVFDAVPLP
jgi:MoxR-like ATPase